MKKIKLEDGSVFLGDIVYYVNFYARNRSERISMLWGTNSMYYLPQRKKDKVFKHAKNAKLYAEYLEEMEIINSGN